MSLTIESICQLLDIDTPEKFWDKNVENCECCSKGQEVWEASRNEYIIAEHDYTCESCSFDYQGQVVEFFRNLLSNFSLELVERKNGTFLLLPKTKNGWGTVAGKIIEVINGYGLFHFSSIGDGVRSGPYKTPRNFCLNHLGWIPSYYEVYEGGKAKNAFSRFAFRR